MYGFFSRDFESLVLTNFRSDRQGDLQLSLSVLKYLLDLGIASLAFSVKSIAFLLILLFIE